MEELHPLEIMRNGDPHTKLPLAPLIDLIHLFPEQTPQQYTLTRTLLHSTSSME